MEKTSDEFISDHIPVYDNNKIVGKITSSVYSPRLKKNIGLALLDRNRDLNSTNLKLVYNNSSIKIKISKLPFLRRK